MRSVLAQTTPAWQLVVVDDGSTDHTREVLEEFRRRDERIVVVQQKNRGLAAARNVGIRVTEGDAVAFLDSDDEYLPDHLEWRMRYLERRPSVAMVYGGLIVRGPKEKQYVVDLEDRRRKIHVSRCYVGGTFMVRRDVLQKVGGFRPIAFGEDFDLVRRIERRYRVEKVAKKSYVYFCDTVDRLCDLYTEKLRQDMQGQKKTDRLSKG
jgi:glycosyltransferase involved in cell wall biosynthesis